MLALILLLSETPPQADTLGAFAPLLGMMGLALLLAVLLNLWHFYDFDRRERQRRQQAEAPSPELRRRRAARPRPAEPLAAEPSAARSALAQEPAEEISALRMPARAEGLRQPHDLHPPADPPSG
jgi:hypothetical protein